jgi:hypothetical protein
MGGAGEGDGVPARTGKRPRRYGKAAREAVLAGVALGETVAAICARPGMPNAGTETQWANAEPDFRARLSRAKTLAGWDHDKLRRAKSYCPVTAQEIFGRLCAGESMRAICRDPAMPGASVVARWQEAAPEFERAVRLAQRVRAEGFADEGWEIACAITPATAYATKVQLEQLRWTAGAMDPARFGRFKAVAHESVAAAEAETGGVKVWQFRHFQKEVLADGSTRMAAYLRDPATGELVREMPGEAVAGGVAEWGRGGCRDA